MTRVQKINQTLTQPFLNREYVDLKKSIRLISKETGFYKATISRKLNEFGIKIHSGLPLGRKRSLDSRTKQSNTLKAQYLLGITNLKDRVGINNGNYKDGRYMQYEKCLDCDKQLTVPAFKSVTKRCGSCAMKWRIANNPELRFQMSLNALKRKPFTGQRNYYKDICFRSSYELAYAKWLDYHEIKWLYEPSTFSLPNGHTYTPDFYLVETTEYIEIKGWFNKSAREKAELFEKTYPNIKYSILLQQHLYVMSVFAPEEDLVDTETGKA